jgi:hypothetical protein
MINVESYRWNLPESVILTLEHVSDICLDSVKAIDDLSYLNAPSPFLLTLGRYSVFCG